MNNFLKSDIVDIVTQYIPLVKHGDSEHPYFMGSCPFHGDDVNPSFTVYPNTQLAFCWTCAQEGMDVIGFIRRLNNCSYDEAVELVTTPLSDEKAFEIAIKDSYVENAPDLLMYALRLNKLYHKLDIKEALRVSYTVHQALEEMKLVIASNILCKYGV